MKKINVSRRRNTNIYVFIYGNDLTVVKIILNNIYIDR